MTTMLRAIVTTHCRYKRPPRKRKAAPLEGPAIVRTGAAKPDTTQAPANDDHKSAIVTAKPKRRRGRFGDRPICPRRSTAGAATPPPSSGAR